MISAEQPPDLNNYTFVEKWERGLDPWHEDAFPDELRPQIAEMNLLAGKVGKRREGWFGLDHWGNQVIFVPDDITVNPSSL